jgi:hypothetical protein
MSKNHFDCLGNFLEYRNLCLLIFLFFFFLLPINVLAVSDSMLGYWKFDDTVSSVPDSSGDGGAADLSSLTPARYFSNNVPGTHFTNTFSLDLNPNTGGKITFANQSNLKPTQSLSFSIWIKLDQIPGSVRNIGGNYPSVPNNKGFLFQIDSNYIYFTVGNGSNYAIAHAPISGNVGNWINLIGIWDQSGQKVTIYLNGSEQTYITWGNSIVYDSTTEFKIEPFPGKIDDVRLYDRALTASEISDIASGNHTSATWLGLGSNYSNYSNWNISAKPDPYTLVNIPSTSSPPVFSESVGMAGLTIESGAALNINQYNLTMNDSAQFVNNGTLLFNNNPTQIFSGFVNDTDSGTVIINPTAASTGLKTGSTYYNLTIGITGPGIALTLNSNLAVNGNLHIENGNLNASSNSITVKGDFASSASGIFYPGTSTVYFTGTNQAILGTNDFWNLYKSTSTADTLSFAADGTQTVLNALTLQGASSTSQYLSLRSTTEGTQWHIDPQGTRDVSSLNIKDSHNSNTTPIILTGRNIDAGNNYGWTFDTIPPTVSLNTIQSPSTNSRPSITGTASDVNSAITSVKFQMDSTSGTWSSCLASDGSFNGNIESFSCILGSNLSDGTHTIYIYATDVNIQDSSAISDSFIIDTKDPDISSVSSDPHSTSADISWDTDEDTSSKVEYGKSSSYGHSKTENESNGVKNHDVTISDLTECTEYHYRVISKDDADNESKSSDKSFKTSGCATTTSDSTAATATSTTSTTTATDTQNIPTATAPQNPNQTNQTTSAQTPTAAPASTPQNYNGETSTDWQKKYFSNEYCYEENRCGGQADPDNDGVSNNDEFRFNTDPNNPDSDNDGLKDGVEIESGHDPTKAQDGAEGDQMTFESPRENGKIVKDKYEVKNVEYVDISGKKKLKISGKGPPNTYLTVYVFSDPVVLTVKTDADGNWSYVLDNNLDDGNHEVYVAVTDNTGKISAKSEPIAFVKTAEAVTVIPPAEAAAEKNAQPVTKKRFGTDLVLVVSFTLLGLLAALLLVGLYRHKSGKKDTEENPNQYISM